MHKQNQNPPGSLTGERPWGVAIKMIRNLAGLFCLVVLVSQSAAQVTSPIEGTVVDRHGLVIAAAGVTLRVAGRVFRTTTDSSGLFSFERVSANFATLEVAAEGYETTTVDIVPPATSITVTLAPRGISEQVTVTRAGTRLDETPASVTALSRTELATTAALTVDDVLRQVPGFSLFRRAGSRTANPTTQGVSLRGIGGSGASRALILADGISLNDPFGGWVYWGRVPSVSIEQVEVLRGPSGDLYGSSAIGGVVSIRTRRPVDEPMLSFEASYGSQQTPSVSFFGSAGVSDWAGSIAGEVLQTDGYIPVAPEDRGNIDTPAGVRRSVFIPTLRRRFTDGSYAFLTAEFFQERRTNGTLLQFNDTNLRTLSGGVDLDLGRSGTVDLRAHAGSQRYNQSFSSITADRSGESLTRLQHVPSEFAGAAGQWNRNFQRTAIFAGFDLRQVKGRSDETGFTATVAASESSAGGSEFTSGVFGGAVIPISTRLQVSGTVRYDRWRNYDGFSMTRSLVNQAVTATSFTARSESALSPRASALLRVTRNFSIAGNISSGFRRPTLNELYRNFRVGNVITLANAELQAERAIGGDASVIINGFDRRLFVRTAIFCTRISRNVANITLSSGPGTIVRQRFNVGRTRTCGMESDGQYRIAENLRVSAGYLFADARVTSFPPNTALEGLRIPQVSRHQFTAQAEYSSARIVTSAVQLRASGSQFDDDQNQFRLAGYVNVDVFVSRRFGKNVSGFVSVENIFNARIESGRTPVLTLATPRTARIGIRVTFGGGR